MSFPINEVPPSLTINGAEYEVLIKEFKKKNSSIIVKHSAIEIRLSKYLTNSQKQHHIEELLNSITKKLQKKSQKQPTSFRQAFERGYFYCGGKCFTLQSFSGRGVKRIENTLYIGDKSELKAQEKRVEAILINEFSSYMEQRVAFINAKSFNYHYKDIIIKYVSSKWGHCTSSNELLFNIKLMNAPLEVFDYVIYHELAHIKVKNHSQRFWREVERFCPNHKSLRNILKTNPPELYKHE